MANGIISKERVKKNGEVFTPDEIVNDMLDLMETDEFKSLPPYDANNITNPNTQLARTILEPTCGNGNILIRILDRKLKIIHDSAKSGGYFSFKASNNDEIEYGKRIKIGIFTALSSIYGVDITADNVLRSRQRMYELITTGKVKDLEYLNTKIDFNWFPNGITASEDSGKSLKFILRHNIVCGNIMTGKEIDVVTQVKDSWRPAITDELHFQSGKELGPLYFLQYKIQNDSVIIRKVYTGKFDDNKNNMFINALTKNVYSNTSKEISINELWKFRFELDKLQANTKELASVYGFIIGTGNDELEDNNF